MLAGGWIGRVAATAIGLIASFIAHRAERRLLRELDKLDDRLLDDIGIDRSMLGRPPRSWRTSRTGNAAAAPALIRAARNSTDNKERWS
jgi:uncharacterized protein DUF1127